MWIRAISVTSDPKDPLGAARAHAERARLVDQYLEELQLAGISDSLIEVELDESEARKGRAVTYTADIVVEDDRSSYPTLTRPPLVVEMGSPRT